MPSSINTTTTTTAHPSHDGGGSSPVAPAYSPITPKVQPALPANGHTFAPPPDNGGTFNFTPPAQQDNKPPIAPTQYIKQPPNQPFSGDDATDAIALRAAISTLQIQKKKAQDDLQTLSDIKKLALENPHMFKSELAAGRLKEQTPKIGDFQAILDETDEDESHAPDKMVLDSSEPFPRIPGPQNVVRTPHINWDKYHVVGAPLESMHEQQQRWPGLTYNTFDRGREHTVAAPYSPFLDKLDDQRPSRDTHPAHEVRKDSAAQHNAGGSPTEHPKGRR
ncbi:Hypothetical predicted protein [Lecanosticta acicola]|uniref:Uncharacterized protein n=1 Tax=Lecanosticta acicola TaxID=111012 RepID=A0AAI8Z3E6_9PEZI|nr:Hypothetical predicted protein [Lecanosticta acicola]